MLPALQNVSVEILNPKVTVSGSEALSDCHKNKVLMNGINACDDESSLLLWIEITYGMHHCSLSSVREA